MEGYLTNAQAGKKDLKSENYGHSGYAGDHSQTDPRFCAPQLRIHMSLVPDIPLLRDYTSGTWRYSDRTYEPSYGDLRNNLPS